MEKSPDAFRTISEVSDWLDTPAHVLRFWESRFSQVKPVKRAGGRRYYRPSDMLLLGGIKKLLHEDGMTIRGVQKILREQGVKHVSSLSAPLTGGPVIDLAPEAPMAEDVAPEAAEDNVVSLKVPEAPDAAPAAAETPPRPEEAAPDAHAPEEAAKDSATPGARAEPAAEAPASEPEPAPPAPPEPAPEAAPPRETEQQEMAFLDAPPLGADLPQSDPADDALPLTGPPLSARLRDTALRRRLRGTQGPALNAALERLTSLAGRMSDGG